jgi:hypothetical protein
MSSIKLTIPPDLTAARFRRVNPSINVETAQELAAELHDIIACLQRHCASQPRPYPGFEEGDLIQTLLRTVVDISPSDQDGAACESIWLMEMVTLFGGNELYLRTMRLFDRVNGTDLVTEFELDRV